MRRNRRVFVILGWRHERALVCLLCLHSVWDALSLHDYDGKVRKESRKNTQILQLIISISSFSFLSATVAKKLHDDCFALIFGINTLVALILQSLLTLVTITILEFGVRVQFQIYASWFFVLAFAFSVVGVIKTIKQKCTNKNMVKTISECR